jgi:hypothetical protein
VFFDWCHTGGSHITSFTSRLPVYEVGKFTDAKKLLRQIFGDKRQEVTEEKNKAT